MSSPVFVESPDDSVTGMLLFMAVVKRFVSKRLEDYTVRLARANVPSFAALLCRFKSQPVLLCELRGLSQRTLRLKSLSRGTREKCATAQSMTVKPHAAWSEPEFGEHRTKMPTMKTARAKRTP